MSSPTESPTTESADASRETCVMMGAGPAGLTSAWALSQTGHPVVVWESDPRYVGGISRTVEQEGYRFDIGGHRFFSKSDEVNEVWHRIMPNDLIECPRLSRIYYKGKFFNYPLEAMDAFLKLGPVTTTGVVLSYLYARMFPIKPEPSLEDWVVNRFGRKLFSIFFKSYTEKVWGIDCNEISADWAAQRIKGLSLREAILNAFAGKKAEPTAKTLIRQFLYPRLGPGQMWETATDTIRKDGGQVLMGHTVKHVHWQGNRVSHISGVTEDGREVEQHGDRFISSIPLQELILAMTPAAPDAVLKAAKSLRYRDFLSVCLVVNEPDIFPDTWIYIHDPSVKVGRVQNYKNWSAAMVPDSSKTSLGLEYFCFEGDEMWTMSDEKLQELATKEIGQIGLAKPDKIEKAFIVRMPKAYPIYDQEYHKHVDVIKNWLNTFSNIQPVGRNGMHHYNNQDHSMMTALLAARNIDGGDYDCWKVNTDAEYHEAGESGTSRSMSPIVPAPKS
ncbi:MAG TPA: NAD(P)/FAD-dependent oxidoreductase [Candidatus Methylacidiphilales bacterium]|nr:NAD(P)/FAD-dependent oxidoreductase [Candidatus Methylacidiphilales bacterium]